MNTTDWLMAISFGILAYFIGISIYFWKKEHRKDVS